jgi:hypothetical protein
MLRYSALINIIVCLSIYSMEPAKSVISDREIIEQINSDFTCIQAKYGALDRDESLASINLTLSAEIEVLRSKINGHIRAKKIDFIEGQAFLRCCNGLYDMIMKQRFQDANKQQRPIPAVQSKKIMSVVKQKSKNSYATILTEYGIGMAALAVVLNIFGVSAHKQKAVDEQAEIK